MKSVNEILNDNNIVNPWENFASQLPVNMHGWFGQSNKRNLSRLIYENDVKIALEIGAWLGESTVFIANLVDLIVTVDTWEGSECHKNGEHGVSIQGRDFKQSLNLLQEQFLVNTALLKEKICPIKIDSTRLNELKLPTFDLVYIDGDHSRKMVANDMEKGILFLKNGGIVCGDDYCGSWPGVIEAVNAFANAKSYHLHVDENFWWFKI